MGLVLPASAARPRTGDWSGSTSQGHPIRFDVSSGKREVGTLRVAVRARCARGPALLIRANLAGPFPVSGGAFRVRGGELQVRGAFVKKGRAQGTLRWRGRDYSPTWKSRRCDSDSIEWSARRLGA